MVIDHRKRAGRTVFVLDPKTPETGFNALDWIGRFGGTKEEDIASVASWIMTDMARTNSVRDDFFRASALQLLTALIADVCLSGHTEQKDQHLRQVRANLSEPEPKLRQRLQAIYDNSQSRFVKENVASFVNMTPETFSGVYANAVKETHWLSYENYAALVSGGSFSTDELAAGTMDVFINLDLKTLENHPGLARLIIGSLMNAIYNRAGEVVAALARDRYAAPRLTTIAGGAVGIDGAVRATGLAVRLARIGAAAARRAGDACAGPVALELRRERTDLTALVLAGDTGRREACT